MTTQDKNIAPGKDADKKPMTTNPDKSGNNKDGDLDQEFEQNTPHKAQPERANGKEADKRANKADDVDGDMARNNVAQNQRAPQKGETPARDTTRR